MCAGGQELHAGIAGAESIQATGASQELLCLFNGLVCCLKAKREKEKSLQLVQRGKKNGLLVFSSSVRMGGKTALRLLGPSVLILH